MTWIDVVRGCLYDCCTCCRCCCLLIVDTCQPLLRLVTPSVLVGYLLEWGAVIDFHPERSPCETFKAGPLGWLNFCVSYLLEWSGLLTPGDVSTCKDRLQNFHLGPKDRLKFCVNYVLEWSGLLTPADVNTWKVSPAKLSPGSPG